MQTQKSKYKQAFILREIEKHKKPEESTNDICKVIVRQNSPLCQMSTPQVVLKRKKGFTLR